MADHPRRERDMKLPAVEHGGRWYTKYDPNIALDIVERIADGELLSKITAKDAKPLTITKQTFLRWVSSVPELSKAYAAAIQISAHSFEEKAIDKAERTADAPGSPANVSAASLLVGQYRWSAARRNPTRYSDKGNTQIVVPVTINSTLNLGTADGSDAVEVPDIYTISLPSPQGEGGVGSADDIEEGEYSDVADQSTETETVERNEVQIKKEDFRNLLDVDTPVVGLSRQPLLRRMGKGGYPLGRKRKRQLTPREFRHPQKKDK